MQIKNSQRLSKARRNRTRQRNMKDIRKALRPAMQAETLEARQLLAADLIDVPESAPVVESTPVASNSLEFDLTSFAEVGAHAAQLRQLVILDASVPDQQTLIADLESQGVEYFVLNGDQDGISQVSNILSSRSDIDALHIISHGTAGQVQLGDSWIDAPTLEQRSEEIVAWGGSLADGADVLFYGCELAGSEAGEQFLAHFGKLTGSDVAASTDRTGLDELGGDWQFEYQTGQVTSSVVFSTPTQVAFRGVLVAEPTVTLGVPAEQFIGEAFQMSVTFDNTGSGSDTGYGPFIDLLVPTLGIDGETDGGDPDGVTINSAKYLGNDVTTTVLEFPASGTVTHPYAVDTSGNPLQVTGTPGDTLYVFQLPFGSLTPNQPEVTVEIDATISNLADLGEELEFRARGGFQFGLDELDNPATDPTYFLPGQATANSGAWSEAGSITPKLIELIKTTLAPEEETATGPNFVRQWEIVIDIADGQTITDLDIIDDLPNNIVFQTLDSVTFAGTGTKNSDNANSLSTVRPNNGAQLTVNVDATGTAGAEDVVVLFSFYVPEFDADGYDDVDVNGIAPDNERVIPVSGEDDIEGTPDRPDNDNLQSISPNDAHAIGDWAPIDSRDDGGMDNAVAVTKTPIGEKKRNSTTSRSPFKRASKSSVPTPTGTAKPCPATSWNTRSTSRSPTTTPSAT